MNMNIFLCLYAVKFMQKNPRCSEAKLPVSEGQFPRSNSGDPVIWKTRQKCGILFFWKQIHIHSTFADLLYQPLKVYMLVTLWYWWYNVNHHFRTLHDNIWNHFTSDKTLFKLLCLPYTNNPLLVMYIDFWWKLWYPCARHSLLVTQAIKSWSVGRPKHLFQVHQGA